MCVSIVVLCTIVIFPHLTVENDLLSSSFIAMVLVGALILVATQRRLLFLRPQPQAEKYPREMLSMNGSTFLKTWRSSWQHSTSKLISIFRLSGEAQSLTAVQPITCFFCCFSAGWRTAVNAVGALREGDGMTSRRGWEARANWQEHGCW